MDNYANNIILVKTSTVDWQGILSSEDHIIEVNKIIDFSKEYPGRYFYNEMLIWIVKEDMDSTHYIINTKCINQISGLHRKYSRIVNIGISYIRNNKLEEIGI